MAEAGTTLYTAGPVRRVDLADAGTRHYLNVDGGLSDNPRPTMYGSRHEVVHGSRPLAAATTNYDIVGKHCETDLLFRDVPLPESRRGDLIAVLCTGAYTYAQASNYNRFPRPAVVFASGGRSRLSLRRETYADLAACEVVQPWEREAPIRTVTPDRTGVAGGARPVPVAGRSGLTFRLGDVETVPHLEPVWNEFHDRLSRVGGRLGAIRSQADAWRLTSQWYMTELAAGSGLLVVTENAAGEVLGFAFGHSSGSFAFWAGYERVIELDDVVVSRTSRRLGVAHPMLDCFETHARARGFTACRGFVVYGDEPIQRFWESRGFRPAMYLYVLPFVEGPLPSPETDSADAYRRPV